MKRVSTNFNLVISAIFIVASSLAFFYFPFAGLKTISADYAIIRFPKYLLHQIIPSSINNYHIHQFQLSGTGERSSITISIPIGPTNGTDISDIRAFFGLPHTVNVLEVKLHGITGQKAQERRTPTPGDIFTPLTNYYELYPSHIASSPLIITYTKVDGAEGLDQELAMIKKYLRWSIGKVIVVPSANRLINTSTRISVLDDLSEPHLDQATASDIQKNILVWDQYQTTTDFGLLSDCGESENSRLFASINNERKFQTLNNIYTLIVTPNPKKWNVTQAQAFTQDPTVLCGVGASMPIYTDTTHILWSFRCLGGVMPDKRSPNYSKEISCLQTSEVVANYFGIESME